MTRGRRGRPLMLPAVLESIRLMVAVVVPSAQGRVPTVAVDFAAVEPLPACPFPLGTPLGGELEARKWRPGRDPN